MEHTILSECLSFRVGTYQNVQDAGSIFTPTAGIGIRIDSFRLDLAGGYDCNESGAIASGARSLIFYMVRMTTCSCLITSDVRSPSAFFLS